jgi:hypothetical protein
VNAKHLYDDILLAKTGNEEAQKALHKRSEPLINKFSRVNGCIDEELKLELYYAWYLALKTFDPSRCFSEDEEEAGQP